MRLRKVMFKNVRNLWTLRITL